MNKKRFRRMYVVLVAAGLGPGAARAQAPASQPATGPAGAASRPAAFRLESLAWMAGQWAGELPAGRMEEHWSRPAGGQMMGMFRLISMEGQIRVIELELLRQVEEGVELRFRHFTPELEPWEEKEQTPRMLLTEMTDAQIIFVNPESGVRPNTPHRLIMDRSGPDRYRVRVEVLRDGQVTEFMNTELRRVMPR